MAKAKVVTFTVTGRFPFPMDMLRYDGCYPTDSDSAAEIRASIEQVENRIYTVRLESSYVHVPTERRWHSFLWTARR
jgi:hypothetical protein